MDDAAIAYDDQGLVPCVIQDWHSGEVLTLAYMNAEALAATRRTGELHLWSRSRDELWHKGATSGNTQAVRAIRYDCDGDALLALVEPAGPACHTGERTCFHRGELEPPAPHEVLPGLERTIAERAATRAGGLLHGAAARRPAVRRREGPGGGRGGRPRRARGDRRARGRGGRRRALPPRRAAARPRPVARRRGGGAAWPSPLKPSCGSASARPSTRCARSPSAHNLVPVSQTFLEDCETPVSAFLKLRGAGPAFLLESAEQGQRVGRWSFIGYRPRHVVRWSLADGGDPYALAAAEVERHRQAPLPNLPPFAGGAVGFFGYDCVRTVEPLGDAERGHDRAARPGADAHRRARRVRPPQAHGHDPRQRLRRGGGRRGRLRARARRDRRGPRAARRPAAAAGGRRRAGARVRARTCRARRSRRWSRGSSSTSTPATRSRSCRRSAGRPRSTSTRSRSTAGCGRSTRRRTCTSSTSRTSRSSARRPSRSSRSPAAAPRRGRSPARARAAATSSRTRRSRRTCSPTRRSAPST